MPADTMAEINDETRLQRNREIISTQIDGETVMMSEDFENYFGMARVGSRIWELLEEKISFAQLIEELMKGFEVTEEQCRQETLAFLQELEKNDLLNIG
ncbi:MAG: PqqD family peptide modification chaperone [Verrucomicrobiota bacterium]